MRYLIVAALALFTLPAHAKKDKPAVVPDPPSAEVVELILTAPGALHCYKNAGALSDRCKTREKGLEALMRVYQNTPDTALELLRQRLEMDPDPHGVFFAILAASQIREPKITADLKKLKAREPDSVMGAFASQAISIIETGACTKEVSPDLIEICPPA